MSPKSLPAECKDPPTSTRQAHFQMPTKEVCFQKGPLGLMTQGLGGIIEIVYCTEDGQAYCKGLAPGDVIVSVNGKPLVEQLRNTGDS